MTKSQYELLESTYLKHYPSSPVYYSAIRLGFVPSYVGCTPGVIPGESSHASPLLAFCDCATKHIPSATIRVLQRWLITSQSFLSVRAHGIKYSFQLKFFLSNWTNASGWLLGDFRTVAPPSGTGVGHRCASCLLCSFSTNAKCMWSACSGGWNHESDGLHLHGAKEFHLVSLGFLFFFLPSYLC